LLPPSSPTRRRCHNTAATALAATAVFHGAAIAAVTIAAASATITAVAAAASAAVALPLAARRSSIPRMCRCACAGAPVRQ
jgi:hypothetical protein